MFFGRHFSAWACPGSTNFPLERAPLATVAPPIPGGASCSNKAASPRRVPALCLEICRSVSMARPERMSSLLPCGPSAGSIRWLMLYSIKASYWFLRASYVDTVAVDSARRGRTSMPSGVRRSTPVVRGPGKASAWLGAPQGHQVVGIFKDLLFGRRRAAASFAAACRRRSSILPLLKPMARSSPDCSGSALTNARIAKEPPRRRLQPPRRQTP